MPLLGKKSTLLIYMGEEASQMTASNLETFGPTGKGGEDPLLAEPGEFEPEASGPDSTSQSRPRPVPLHQ